MIVSGKVSSAVWRIAWPTVVNTLVLNAWALINRAFLGRLPNAGDSLAAMGISQAALNIQFALVMGLSAGAGALVSQFLGAGKNEEANEASRQSLLLAVLFGAISGTPLIIWALPMARTIGAQGSVARLSADFTCIVSWFSIPVFVYMIVVTALRSAGDVKSAMYAGAVVLAVNTLLDWLLILPHGHFGGYGIHGAAWATSISRVAGVVVTLWFLKRSVLAGTLSHFRQHDRFARQILSIGGPAMLQQLGWTLAYTAFVWVLSRLPGGPNVVRNVQAGLTLALTIESLAFMPGVAYSQAATPLVGQNLGAGQPDRAAHSAWIATLHAIAIMSACAVVFMVAPGWLARAFTKDAAIVPIVVWYLRINAISEPFLAMNMVLRGSLQGAGDTLVPAIITLATNYVVRLPLAWYLAIHANHGAIGGWIAMSSSTILSGTLMAIWFQMGHWRRRSLVSAAE